MKKTTMLFSLILFLLVQSLDAQVKRITGTVTGESTGDPLPGVSVVVKGTTVGAVTDIEGVYQIDVPSDANVLVFSFIGMISKEVEINNQSSIDVRLQEDVVGLDEVIVTAFGVERSKKSATYSIVEVSADETTQKSEPDLLRTLQGKIPGVYISGSTSNPGAATRITIRGTSSFSYNNQPLFVVDGIPYSNEQYNTTDQETTGGAYGSGISTLDPNSIESVQVLKGTSAAALYGSRAANGVILIKTKGGSTSMARKGLEISYSTSYSVDKIILPEYQNSYGAGHNHTFGAGDNGSWGPRFEDLDSIPMWGNYTAAFGDELPSMLPYEPYPDNVSSLFRDGQIVENSVTVSGGNETSRFSVTATSLNHKGVIPNSEFKRNSLNMGGVTRLLNGVKVSGNFSYTKSDQEGALFGYPYSADAGAATSFGRTLWMNRSWDTDLPYEAPDGSSVFFKDLDHPLWSWEHNRTISNIDRIVAGVDLSYEVIENLEVAISYGVNTLIDRRKQIWDVGSVAHGGVGSIIDYDIWSQEQEGNASLSYSREISSFTVRAVGGLNVNQIKVDNQAFQGSNIIAEGIYEIGNTITQVATSSEYSLRRLYGLYADVQLGFRDYLFLIVTGRNDFSSTLPEKNRSYFYPSFGTSFVFSEAFDLTSNTFSFGKVSATYGKVGNDAPVYSLQDVYNINYYGDGYAGTLKTDELPFNGLPGLTIDNVKSDPELTPEFTTEIELGSQLGFFNNRVYIDFTWYNRSSTDQIASVTVPDETGYSAYITNFGEMTNKGIELGLTLKPLESATGFNWEIFTSFTKNKNEVVSLRNGVDRLNVEPLYSFLSPVIQPGYGYGVFYGDRYLRDDEGNLLVDPGDGGYILDDNQGIIGDPNPDFLLGLTNTFSFKGIRLTAVLDYKHGGDIYSFGVARLLGRGVTKDTEDRDNAYILPGYLGNPDTQKAYYDENGEKIPNDVVLHTNDVYFRIADYGATEYNIYDGTVIRLREIVLGYELPEKLMSKTPFGSAVISFSGRNLWYNAPNIPKYTNFDPEVNTKGASNVQGVDFTNAPSTRRYGVNLKVTF